MAKAFFTHSCGHEGVVIANNRRNADGRAQYLDGKNLCRDCGRAETERERAVAAEQAIAAAHAAGLPALIGRGDKAVRWAETLRAAEIADLDLFVRVLDAAPDFETSRDRSALHRAIHDLTPDAMNDDRLVERLADLQQHLKAAGSARRLRVYRDLLRAKTDAAWWIDRRDLSVQRRVAMLNNEIDDAVTAINAFGADVTTADALDGAVLKPTSEPASAIIVETTAQARWIELPFLGTTAQARWIELRFPVKDADFNAAVKAMGFRWAGAGAWTRDLPPEVGPLEERLAETAQRLLAAGFLVRVASPDVRRRVQTGDFTPEHRRWIHLVATGPFAGWLAPVWERDQDFYAAVMELPGARYRTGGPYVPVGAIEAVAEFAAPNGFLLSPAVAEALRAHRAALESGAVVTSLRAPPEPLPAPPPLAKTPPVIYTPTDVAIAPELLDDEAL